MKRHFEKNREAYQSLVGEKKTQKIEKLPKEFITQKLMFKKSNQESQASSHANYVVAYEIAKQGKPFLEGELVKNCMLEVADIVCLDEQRAFQNVSLSRITITRRVEKIEINLTVVYKNMCLSRWFWMSPRTLALQLNFLFLSKE